MNKTQIEMYKLQSEIISNYDLLFDYQNTEKYHSDKRLESMCIKTIKELKDELKRIQVDNLAKILINESTGQ